MEHNLPKLTKDPKQNRHSNKNNIHININLSNQSDLNNNSKKEPSTNSNKNRDLSLPLINENKRIYIHKPSDFIKNKYTFLGNLANNSELLSREDKKTYHSPKFSMQDIKRKMSIENLIIGSILKDEVDSLPSLLRNLIPGFNKNKSKGKNVDANSNKNELHEKENEFYNNNNKKTINDNSNIFYLNNNNKFLRSNNINNVNYAGNRNDIRAYGLNAEQIAQRANRLVNLNFRVSSGRKRQEPFDKNIHGKYNYKEFFGDNSASEHGYQARSSGKRANNYLTSFDYLQMQGINSA